MGAQNESFPLSVKEAHDLPDADFRRRLVRHVIELEADLGRIFTTRIDFWGRRLDQISTKEMREIVLRYQEWFNPKRMPVRLPANDA
jgi:hypothetical protein